MTQGGRTALLIVDVQRDFCPGGALAAPGGDRIVPVINRCLAEARESGAAVYASRDWHPPVTTHFKEYGGEWPPHCVQGTDGAQFHPDLKLPPDTIVIDKGERADRPGYSAFDGHTTAGPKARPAARTLLDDLRRRRIDALIVAGIATEYCVKQSVLDALRAGLRVTVLRDAIAGIEAHPGDTERALAEMQQAGAEIRPSLVLTRPLGRAR